MQSERDSILFPVFSQLHAEPKPVSVPPKPKPRKPLPPTAPPPYEPGKPRSAAASWKVYFDRHGCVICNVKDEYARGGMCQRCYQRTTNRFKALLKRIG